MAGTGGAGGYPTGGAGSGSGGGSQAGANGGAEGGSEADPCALILDLDIFGLVPGVSNELRIGDSLNVRLTGSSSLSVGMFSPRQGGRQVGTIAGIAQLPILVRCLQNGIVYSGKVLSIESSQIRVRVHNA